jgi:metallothiol transferase
MIKKLNHITFPVSDIKRAAAFYENILGLKKTGEWTNYVEFNVGGVELSIEQNGKLEIFLLVDDVDKSYKSLKEKGVKFVREPKDEHWGGRTATLVDPDGNMFTLVHFKK